MITIIDYNAGNIASIKNMLKKLGIQAEISSDPDEIAHATQLILPGVGHFDHGMQHLKEKKLDTAIIETVKDKNIPILGICLGAQLLGHKSEEGNRPGLGIIDMDIVRFNKSRLNENQKIPHMGWEEIKYKDTYSRYQLSQNESDRFYFVHSYHFNVHDPKQVFCTSHYGYEFVCGVRYMNITGVQFHPEKSHKYGMHFLKIYLNDITTKTL